MTGEVLPYRLLMQPLGSRCPVIRGFSKPRGFLEVLRVCIAKSQPFSLMEPFIGDVPFIFLEIRVQSSGQMSSFGTVGGILKERANKKIIACIVSSTMTVLRLEEISQYYLT